MASPLVSFGVLTIAKLVSVHGFGEARDSIRADTGVGSVDAVAAVVADLGVVRRVVADNGVKGVLILGDSSVRADRMVGSTGVLPDRRRFRESCLVKRGAGEFWAGMTKGARLLGERGCLIAADVDGCESAGLVMLGDD